MKRLTVTRTELVEAFSKWNEKAKVENWDGPPNAEASADCLIDLIKENRRAA